MKRTIGARMATLRERIDALIASTRGGPGAPWSGDALRRARRVAGITQRELAKLMSARRPGARAGEDLGSVTQSHVSRWENGQAPTGDTLVRIVRAFQLAGARPPELLT